MRTKLFYLIIAVLTFGFSGNSQTTCTPGVFNCISLIGPGTPGGDWVVDTYLSTEDGDVYTAVDMQFSVGDVKFRANSCWDDACTIAGVNTHGWGPASSSESGWPTGQNANPVAFGPNIQCPGGVWNVKFTLSTNSWEFTPGTPNPVIKIVGSAVSGESFNMTTKDGIIYTAKKVTLVPGTCQFDIDGVSYGGETFPEGSALGENLFIPVSTTGIDYDVTFDYSTFEYSFAVATFPKVAIVGAATLQGWPSDPQVDANELMTTDGETYTISHIPLNGVAGENNDNALKFRQDNSWAINWGGESFPTGPTNPNSDIFVTESGNYACTFTRSTGAYAFSLNTIAIVGEGVGGWPTGAEGEIDAHVMSTEDGINYTLNDLIVVGGGVKFRENNSWDVNWGGLSFPTGPTDASKDIVSIAGTYNVSFNRVTGAYDFSDALGVKNFNVANLKSYPNPTKSNWTISSSDEITSIKIYDIIGKSVYQNTTLAREVNVNASRLSNGVYFAKVTTAKGYATIKLVKE